MFKVRKELIGDYVANNYYNTCILDSGQTIKIEFQEDWSNDKIYYNIYLVTSNKRKSEDNTYLKTTGKDGLKGLLWAKEQIMSFEEYIKTQNADTPIVIYCQWDNNRRRNVYERGLKSIGYNFGKVFGHKALLKEI